MQPATISEFDLTPQAFVFEQLPIAAHTGFDEIQTTARELLAILQEGFGAEEPYTISDFGAYTITGLVKAIHNHASAFEGTSLVDSKNMAMRGGLGVLATGCNPEAFDDLLRLNSDKAWLDLPLKFEIDCYSAPASRPGATQKSAERLLEKVGTQPQLMVPICNGGLVPGIQVALECGRQGAQDITLYPIPFSRDKLKQKAPAVTPTERAILQEYAKDRIIVVSDEDANFGGTLAGGVALMKELCPNNQVIGFATDDARGPGARRQFGEWWELVGSEGLLADTR